MVASGGYPVNYAAYGQQSSGNYSAGLRPLDPARVVGSGQNYGGCGGRVYSGGSPALNSPGGRPYAGMGMQQSPNSPVGMAAGSPLMSPMNGQVGYAPARVGAQAGVPAMPKTPEEMQVNLRVLMADQRALEQRIRMRFKQLVPNGTLSFEELSEKAGDMAKMLQVDASVFGDISQMFWRFDFSGDGVLDETETVQLALCCLRQWRDATQPPQPGVVKLGGNIRMENVNDRYAISKKLGEGGQGAVYLAQDKGTNKEVVVKFYDKSSPNAPIEDITQEFELMMRLKHPRIAHYFDIFQDWANVYVVQEPYFGGDLTTAVQKASEAGAQVNEKWLARVFHQVLAGIAFLHSHHMMHCDMKEPNVMIAGSQDWHNPAVVVIDFGLANSFDTKSHPGGTPGYMPPEVWSYGLWTPKGDVFSIGVMMFSMRTAAQPFTDGCQTLEDVERLTTNRTYVPEMRLGTPAMKDLVLSMVSYDFRQRPSIAEVINDPWFTVSDDMEQRFDDNLLQGISHRVQSTDLKRAMLAEFASRQNLAEMRELNDLFIRLDADNNGYVSAEEVRAGMQGHWSQSQIEELIRILMGSSGQDVVPYEEFMGTLMAAKAPEENNILVEIWRDAGGEEKGFLDVQDIQALMQRPHVARVLGARNPMDVMRDMDKDANNRVEFNEFKLAMQGASVEQNKHYQVGQQLQYYSVSYSTWVNCTATAVEPRTGAIQIDCKPGYWFKGPELLRKIRPPRKGPSTSPHSGLGKQLFGGLMKMFNKK